MDCLGCGKPLSDRSMLCYTCEQAGVDPASLLECDPELVDRLERFFIIASLRCPNCDDIHGTVTIDDTEYTAADFGIDSIEEWEIEMDKEEAWIRHNRSAVRHGLMHLEDEWPRSVDSVRKRFFG